MLSVPLLPQASVFGQAFERWVILEVYRLNEYLRKDYVLSFLRTKDDAEIDLIIERPGQKTLLVRWRDRGFVSLDLEVRLSQR
jgi:hypothetical protein